MSKILVCPNCGQKNKIEEYQKSKAKCGKCGASLSFSTNNLHSSEPKNPKYQYAQRPETSNIIDLYFHTLKQYATFKGRAKRSELWTFLIVNVIIKILLAVVSVKMGLYITDNPEEDRTLLDGLFAIAVFLPTIAVSVRRIHDIGLSGWWGWIFMPLMIPMIIVSFIDSKVNNTYGIRNTNSNVGKITNTSSGNFIKPLLFVILIIFVLAMVGMINSQNDGKTESLRTEIADTSESNNFIKTKFYEIACFAGSAQKCATSLILLK